MSHFLYCCSALFLLHLPLFAADPTAFRLLIEAEDFGSLIRYPDDRPDLKKWYAREASCRHYGAPGKAEIAAIHRTANTDARTIGMSLQQAIPAGKYKVFARVAGNVFHDDDNIIRLSFGQQAVDFAWQQKRKPTWLDGRDIELKAPTSNLQMTAVQFGGIGLRILYESQARSIWVDSFYITSDMSEGSPTWAVEHSLRTGKRPSVEMFDRKFAVDSMKGLGLLEEVRQLPRVRTPIVTEPVVASVVKLEAFDGRRNLWPNGSFELGLNDGWAATNKSYTYCYIFSEKDHDAQTATHGKYSLRVPAGASPFSRVYELASPGEFTLSAYMKADEPCEAGMSLVPLGGKTRKDFQDPVLSTKCALTKNWKRFHVTGKVSAGNVCLQIKNAKQVWIDSVQFEAGRLTDFQPRAEVEASLASGSLGNILHRGKDTAVQLWMNNSSAAAKNISLRYRIVDVAEQVVSEGKTPPVQVPANSTVSQPFTIPDMNGLFSAIFSVDGRKPPEGELVYAVIPTPSARAARHQLASNMDCLPAAYELMQRMGFKWQLYCKIVTTAAKAMQPEPGEFVWDDTRISLGKQFGMQTLPCLWPTRLPEWMIDHGRMTPERRDIVRMTRNNKPPLYPKLDAWREYCSKLAEHYKEDAPMWTIEDETEMYYTARDFAPIVRASAQGMNEHGVKVGLSCMPDYTEELLTMVDPKFIGSLGASSYGFLGHWPGRKIRHLQNRLGVPWYCIGVGNSEAHVQMFHTIQGYEPIYWSATRTARELVDLCLNQDAKVIGHYTGRLWNRFGHYNSDFPLMDYDGTPLPHGYSYACVGLLLADAVPVGDVKIKSTDTLAYLFELDGRLGAATWSTLVTHYDLHWKPSHRTWRDFMLPVKPDQVELWDMYGNPLKNVRSQQDRVSFDLGEAPVFIMNDAGMNKEDFIKAISNATVAPTDIGGKLKFASNGKGGIDLVYAAKNNSQRDFTGLKLDAGVPPNKLLSKTEWMFPLQASANFGNLKKGESKEGQIPTSITGSEPIENATIQASVTDGKDSFPLFEKLWLMNAPRKANAASEQLSRTPGWIYYTWSWGRFGRDFVQLYENGEHFNYATMLDLRARILTSWDDEVMYVDVAVDDDQFVTNPDGPEDGIEIRFDTNDNGFSLDENNSDDLSVRLHGSEKDKRHVPAKLTTTMKQDGNTWHWTVKIPWKDLKMERPAAGKIIGFDVIVTDVDMEDGKPTMGKIRWAGGAKDLGQLLFTD